MNSNLDFVAIELRYNPLRVAVLMTKVRQVTNQLGIPLEVQEVPLSRIQLDERVSLALADRLGFAARPDYARGWLS